MLILFIGWRNQINRYVPCRSLHRIGSEALVAFREAMKHQGERTDFVDNVNEVRGRDAGNSRAYTLSRLQREAPLLSDDPEALVAFREAMKGKAGRPPKKKDGNEDKTDRIPTDFNSSRERGRSYDLSRLQREAPELFDDPEALVAFRQAMKHQGERTDFGNNVTDVERITGNSRAYTLSRLQREAPQLFDDPEALVAFQGGDETPRGKD